MSHGLGSTAPTSCKTAALVAPAKGPLIFFSIISAESISFIPCICPLGPSSPVTLSYSVHLSTQVEMSPASWRCFSCLPGNVWKLPLPLWPALLNSCPWTVRAGFNDIWMLSALSKGEDIDISDKWPGGVGGICMCLISLTTWRAELSCLITIRFKRSG